MFFKKFQLALASVIGTLALTIGCANVSPTPIAMNSVPADALAYYVTPEGVAFAALHGERFEEAYMAMVRLPAGLVSPPQVKSANMFGVMISGAMVHNALNAGATNDIVLPAGSYYQIPAGVAHVSKCVSEIDCVTFLSQDGKFDFQQVSQ
mgnify:FL=1|tara:strand:+ start:3238 stop:3690 length:453 start_codon:yes stop_codon:yes gene_type:complete